MVIDLFKLELDYFSRKRIKKQQSRMLTLPLQETNYYLTLPFFSTYNFA